MGGCHDGSVGVVAVLVALNPPGRIIEAAQDVLGVNEGHDAVQINGAAESIIHPEQGRKVPRIGEPCGFEEDIVELALLLHQRLDGGHASISAHSRQ